MRYRQRLCADSELAELVFLLDERVEYLERIVERFIHRRITKSIQIRFTGDSMANNALVLKVGQTSQASIVPLLADGVTNSGGTVSAVSYTFNDPSATVVLNSDGITATVTGVAPSVAGGVTGTAICTVTDTDGAVSQWKQAFTIETDPVAPPPQQLTQSVAVQFSTPTP